MAISPKQARAARAHLGLEQKDVNAATGVSINQISTFERETAGLSVKNLLKLEDFYRSKGIEFLDNDGLREKTYGVTTLEGREGFAQFRADVLDEVRKGNPDICVSNVDERLFDKWGEGEVNDDYRSAIADLIRQNPDISRRFLVKQGDSHHTAKGFAEYRWIDDIEFGDFPFYIYGDKTAMILFEEDEMRIFIITQPMITDYFRKQFNEKWITAKIFS